MKGAMWVSVGEFQMGTRKLHNCHIHDAAKEAHEKKDRDRCALTREGSTPFASDHALDLVAEGLLQFANP